MALNINDSILIQILLKFVPNDAINNSRHYIWRQATTWTNFQIKFQVFYSQEINTPVV